MKNKLACLFSLAGSAMLLAGTFFLLREGQAAGAQAGMLYAAPGGSGSSCTQAAPCSLQTARDRAQDGDSIYLAGGVYDQPAPGLPDALLVLTRTIQVLGGWDGAPAGPVVRDPAAYPSVLDGLSQRRVISITGQIAPLLDGLTITGGNASGLGGVLFTGADGGGGIYSVDAAPVIQNNLILSNTASLQSGVRVLGGGLYIETSLQPALILSNTVASNLAGGSSDAIQGEGGGMFLMGPAEVRANTFEKNAACECLTAKGGGIELGWTHDVASFRDNVFSANQAKNGGGLYLVWSAAEVSGNRFVNNLATSSGGGLYAYYDGGSLIQRNTFLGNQAPGGGAFGLYITTGDPLQMTNNLLASNTGVVAGGVYAYSDWHIAAMTMTHNTLVNNQIGVRASTHMTITMQNNILVSHTLAITSSVVNGIVDADHTLFWGNDDDGLAGANSLSGDPGFMSPALHDYRLELPSVAVDAALDLGLADDHDGQPRPSGAAPDLGAFELQFRYLYLPVSQREP